MSDRAAARPGLQPRPGHVPGRRLGQARHRRARHGADRPRLAPRRGLDRVGDDRRRRRAGRARHDGKPFTRALARRRRVPRAPRRVRPRGLRPLLQHLRQPDAVVHPALPLGPVSNAPDIRRNEVEAFEYGYNVVNEDLAARGARGDRGRRRAGRDGPRLPPLHAAGARAARAPGRLPAPLRPHPVDAVGRLARAAAAASARRSTAGCSPTTSSASTRAPTGATSCSAAAT